MHRTSNCSAASVCQFDTTNSVSTLQKTSDVKKHNYLKTAFAT